MSPNTHKTVLLAVALLASARVAGPAHKTLKDLDEEGLRKTHTINEDAPPAVARVNDSGDIQNALDGGDGSLQEVLTGSGPNISAPAPTPDVLFTTDTSSRQHHVEHYLGLIGLQQQASIILFVANVNAYAHLLLLTSRSYYYHMELLQLLMFMCFPTLPFIQLLRNVSKMAVQAVYQWNASSKDTSFFLAAACGAYVLPPSSEFSLFSEPRIRLVDASIHDLDQRTKVRSLSWLVRMPLLAVTVLASATALHVWRDLPTRSDWDAAAIARDARNGWLAVSGTLAAVQAILVHGTPAQWKLRPHRAPATSSGLLAEVNVFAEIVSAALLQDAAAAAMGGTSLVGFMCSLAADRIVLLVLIFAVALVAHVVRGLAGGALGTRPLRHGGWRVLAVACTAVLCTCVVLFQEGSILFEQRDLDEEPWLVSDTAPPRMPRRSFVV